MSPCLSLACHHPPLQPTSAKLPFHHSHLLPTHVPLVPSSPCQYHQFTPFCYHYYFIIKCPVNLSSTSSPHPATKQVDIILILCCYSFSRDIISLLLYCHYSPLVLMIDIFFHCLGTVREKEPRKLMTGRTHLTPCRLPTPSHHHLCQYISHNAFLLVMSISCRYTSHITHTATLVIITHTTQFCSHARTTATWPATRHHRHLRAAHAQCYCHLRAAHAQRYCHSSDLPIQPMTTLTIGSPCHDS